MDDIINMVANESTQCYTTIWVFIIRVILVEGYMLLIADDKNLIEHVSTFPRVVTSEKILDGNILFKLSLLTREARWPYRRLWMKLLHYFLNENYLMFELVHCSIKQKQEVQDIW